MAESLNSRRKRLERRPPSRWREVLRVVEETPAPDRCPRVTPYELWFVGVADEPKPTLNNRK